MALRVCLIAVAVTPKPGAYGTNSSVSMAPPMDASTADSLTALWESRATQIVSLSSPPSAEEISTLYASKVPAGTVTFSTPETFNCISFTFCFWMSKFRNVAL